MIHRSVWGTVPIHDPNGNLTGDGTKTYGYDFENRLVNVTGPGLNAQYTYDGFGRRIKKQLPGQTTYFIHDGDQVIEERGSGNVLQATYTYGSWIDEALTMSRASQVYYYFYDGLGSVTDLTKSTGELVESYSYDPYGQPNAPSTVGNPYLYTGREYDSETGLYHYRARAYHPGIGRFMQRDTIYGINLYMYVRNNPINITDPWGLAPGDKYSTQDEAASAAMNGVADRSVREDSEYAGWVYQNSDGTYSYNPATKGSAHSSHPGSKPPAGTAYYHTHGAESGPDYKDEEFSPADKSFSDFHNADGYLHTPSGKQQKYDSKRKNVGDVDRARKSGPKEGQGDKPAKRGKDNLNG